MQIHNIYMVSLTSGPLGTHPLCRENPLSKWILRIGTRFAACRGESKSTETIDPEEVRRGVDSQGSKVKS